MASSTKQRLRYIDSDGNEQVIGVIQGPNDEEGLTKAQKLHKYQGHDQIVARGNVELASRIPSNDQEFQNPDVPAIFFDTYDPEADSWTTRFRGFTNDGGQIDRNEEVKLTLWDFTKYYGTQEVDLSITSATTNVDIMKDAVNGLDVVIDHPTESEVQNNSDQDGFIDYPEYSLNGQRKRVFYEQTKIIGWVLKPTASQDSNGNWIWRYEPIGYGGTVDNLQERGNFQASADESLIKIREWIFDQKKNIINAVELINTSKDGTTVVGSYSAASETSPNSVDKYGERYQNFQVGFSESNSNADQIAKNIVDRNKEADEGGNAKATPRYEGNEVNNSFAVGSEKKGIYIDEDVVSISTDTVTVSGNVTGNITENDRFKIVNSTGNDGTYTVGSLNYDSTNDETDITIKTEFRDSTADGQVRIFGKVFYPTSQINFYPENATDFRFTYEREQEKQAFSDENLRAERSKLYPQSPNGLSGNTGNTAPGVSGDTGSTGPDVGGNTGDTSPNVAGNSDSNMSDAANSNPQDQSLFGATAGSQFQDSVSVPNLNNSVIVIAWITVQARASNSDFIGGQLTIENTDSNTVLFDEGSTSTSYQPGDSRTFQVVQVGSDLDFDDIQFTWEMTSDNGGDDVRFSYGVNAIGDHDHGSGSYDADFHPHDDGSLDTDNHPHDDGSLGTDNHPHDTGTLEAETAEEDKTDR